jgi:multidrug efflux pump subunit AcrB
VGKRPLQLFLRRPGGCRFVNVVTEGPSDISFSAMTARTRQVADILLKDPAVDYLNITTGVGGANATGNFGRALVALKPRGQREDAGTVVKRLRVKANSFVGVTSERKRRDGGGGQAPKPRSGAALPSGLYARRQTR